MSPFILLLLSYLLGSIPTSFWVGRTIYRVDLRKLGSGNLGATNTFRVLGWKAALPVFIVDVAKGFVPAWYFPRITAVGLQAAPQLEPVAPLGWAIAYGAAAILGHVFSVWVRFKGGKGIATSAGVFLGLAPWAVLAGFIVWGITVATTRIVSLASMLSAITIPIAVWLLPHRGGMPLQYFTIALAAFVIWAHRDNVRRLMKGEEHRFGRGPGRHVVPPVEADR